MFSSSSHIINKEIHLGPAGAPRFQGPEAWTSPRPKLGPGPGTGAEPTEIPRPRLKANMQTCEDWLRAIAQKVVVEYLRLKLYKSIDEATKGNL